jgi:diguanylate cyclase (GGDEF)-like protein
MALPETLPSVIQSSFLSLPPSATIKQAIEMMVNARESCVLVIESGKLLGIFTERDVVKSTANNRLNHPLLLTEVMTQKLVTVKVSETKDIFALSRLLSTQQIRHLPVLNEQGQVVGVITPRSLRASLKPEYLLRYVRAADVMSREVIQGLPSESVIALTQKMARHRVSCIVIIHQPTLAPIGIITERDIVRFHQMNLDLVQTSAQEVMSQPLSIMHPQDSLWYINQQMHELNVRRLVIAEPSGKLAGIVTQSQMTKMLNSTEMYHVMELMQEVIDRQTAELQQLNQQLLQANADLVHLSTIDALTQVVNRRKFDEFVTGEWQRLLQVCRPLSLIMCDVDYFKIYNDTYGHLAGDKCLKQVAQAIREVTRKNSDLVARYGGEEFAIVLPNTDSVGAENAAKTILKQIQDLQIPFFSAIARHVTISLGVATIIPAPDRSLETLLKLADQLLYQAKQQGRNTYVVQDLTVKSTIA